MNNSDDYNNYDSSEYMSVADGFSVVMNPSLPEPIYHTLEPPTSEDELPPSTRPAASNNRKGRKDNSKVYINDDLEVVVKRPNPTSGGAAAAANANRNSAKTWANQYRHQKGNFMEGLGYDDEDDEETYEDEELLAVDYGYNPGGEDMMFGRVQGTSRPGVISSGSYVPSPAPGSMPRPTARFHHQTRPSPSMNRQNQHQQQQHFSTGGRQHHGYFI